MLPEGAVLEGIFLYLALPGLFSMVAALYRPSWNDVAAIVWAMTVLLYILDFGVCYVIAGTVPIIAHALGAVKYRYANKAVTAVQKTEKALQTGERDG